MPPGHENLSVMRPVRVTRARWECIFDLCSVLGAADSWPLIPGNSGELRGTPGGLLGGYTGDFFTKVINCDASRHEHISIMRVVRVTQARWEYIF